MLKSKTSCILAQILVYKLSMRNNKVKSKKFSRKMHPYFGVIKNHNFKMADMTRDRPYELF